MKLRNVIIVLSLGLIVAGCNPFASAPARWSLEVTGYETVRALDTGSAVSGVLESEEGATWLRLFVSLTNHADELYEIAWQEDAFIFADEDGVTVPEQLELANLSGYLDPEFGPGQTNEGFVVFQVESPVDVTAGTLTWKPRAGNLINVELGDVPEKESGGS